MAVIHRQQVVGSYNLSNLNWLPSQVNIAETLLEPSEQNAQCYLRSGTTKGWSVIIELNPFLVNSKVELTVTNLIRYHNWPVVTKLITIITDWLNWENISAAPYSDLWRIGSRELARPFSFYNSFTEPAATVHFFSHTLYQKLCSCILSRSWLTIRGLQLDSRTIF